LALDYSEHRDVGKVNEEASKILDRLNEFDVIPPDTPPSGVMVMLKYNFWLGIDGSSSGRVSSIPIANQVVGPCFMLGPSQLSLIPEFFQFELQAINLLFKRCETLA